jgi:hypothetical protein
MFPVRASPVVAGKKESPPMTKMYRVDCSAEAELKVYVTDVRMDADLVVFETSDEWAATEPEIWYYTDVMSLADRVICFTKSRWEADLVIFKTLILPDAGWIDETKSHLL